MNNRELTCEERIDSEFETTISGIKEAIVEDRIIEFGLYYDYIGDHKFIQWQISWGGPSDEFRYFIDQNGEVISIEYWFMDWHDGAKRELNIGSDEWNLLIDVFEIHGGKNAALKMIKKWNKDERDYNKKKISKII